MTTKTRKQEVTDMLKRKNGATVEQICTKTGMLPHSARALISGIRADEKVTTSKSGDKPTIYFIIADQAEAA